MVFQGFMCLGEFSPKYGEFPYTAIKTHDQALFSQLLQSILKDEEKMFNLEWDTEQIRLEESKYLIINEMQNVCSSKDQNV